MTATQIPLTPAPINAHQVLEAWDEGNLSGVPGVANHTTRQNAVAWTNAGAGTPSSASVTIAGSFTLTMGRQAVPLQLALIEQWVRNPATNHGVVLISTTDESTRIASSEGAPSTDRPVLSVTFVP